MRHCSEYALQMMHHRKPFLKCEEAIQKSWAMNIHPHSGGATRDLHDVAAVSQVPLPDRRLSGWLIGNLLPEVTLQHVLHRLICLPYKHRLSPSINVQISNVIIESPKRCVQRMEHHKSVSFVLPDQTNSTGNYRNIFLACGKWSALSLYTHSIITSKNAMTF